MKLSKEEIVPVVREMLEGRAEILFAYFFGSFVEETKFRDLDIGVFVTEPALVADGLNYSLRLSGDLENKTGYAVDVILMNSAPDHLIHSISKGAVLVNRNETCREEFFASSWSRYMDFRPIRHQALADLFE